MLGDTKTPVGLEFGPCRPPHKYPQAHSRSVPGPRFVFLPFCAGRYLPSPFAGDASSCSTRTQRPLPPSGSSSGAARTRPRPTGRAESFHPTGRTVFTLAKLELRFPPPHEWGMGLFFQSGKPPVLLAGLSVREAALRGTRGLGLRDAHWSARPGYCAEPLPGPYRQRAGVPGAVQRGAVPGGVYEPGPAKKAV